jgi:phosphoribosyl 1,2-cyclic phosphate phosphodiesterase
VPHLFQTTSFTGELVLLGTGTSVGVPVIGCGCEVCQSANPRNHRTRCSAILGLPEGNLLIDTGPDLRFQLLREGIGIVHAVLFTHEHADHLHGMDDLRLFPFHLNAPVPILATETVQDRITRVFDYAFDKREHTHLGAAPQLNLVTIDTQPFVVLGQLVIPIPMIHGPHCNVLGFRFGNVAYCTDTNFIPPSSMELLQDLDCLILDALRYTSHPTHFNVEDALRVIETLRPKKTYLTHMSHELEYDQANSLLPAGVELGYDGLRIPLT